MPQTSLEEASSCSKILFLRFGTPRGGAIKLSDTDTKLCGHAPPTGALTAKLCKECLGAAPEDQLQCIIDRLRRSNPHETLFVSLECVETGNHRSPLV